MAFNAESYRMNRHRRDRDARLAEARALKVRAAAGEAYQWEVDRLPLIVDLARTSNRLFLSYRRARALSRSK